MRILAVIFGIVMIVLVAQDAIETIVLPRRVTRRIRLARLFYRLTQIGWKSIGHLIRSSAWRESFRGYVGPLTLLGLLVFWAVLFVFGFGLLLQSLEGKTFLVIAGALETGLVQHGPYRFHVRRGAADENFTLHEIGRHQFQRRQRQHAGWA